MDALQLVKWLLLIWSKVHSGAACDRGGRGRGGAQRMVSRRLFDRCVQRLPEVETTVEVTLRSYSLWQLLRSHHLSFHSNLRHLFTYLTYLQLFLHMPRVKNVSTVSNCMLWYWCVLEKVTPAPAYTYSCTYLLWLTGGFFGIFHKYFIRHFFICRP